MKKTNTFTLQNTDDKTPPRSMFASVPKVGKPHGLYAPQRRLNYQATGPPNPQTYANNSTNTQTNTVNAGNSIDTNPQTYANNTNTQTNTVNASNHVDTNAQTNANSTTNAQHQQYTPHQQRNWNCLINSFQHAVSTQKTPVYYTSHHRRGRSCYYSTFTNSTGSKTVNTNNISITSN